MSASTEFAASLPFFSYRQRNAVIDNFFYDTASLTLEEKAKLSPLVDREGSIIVVPPSNSDRRIRHYKSALRFRNKGADHPRHRRCRGRARLRSACPQHRRCA